MKRYLALFPALLYAATIAFISHIPGLQPPAGVSWADKLIHALLYAGFGLALALALTAQLREGSFRMIALWTLLLGGLYAAADEVHQLFVPHRVADITDWLADVLGLCLSLPMSRFFNQRWRQWLQKP
ncbi:MAG: VanZ family protein [Candidatus Kapabacteria bacterium]|nr:VanZ family protein [Candidatus Kapabacteria bacterium]MCS7169562.1 VanZ family protein [Candidatus Kapabacteria bacterium]MDW7997799.1 VanZ family protein [Bacteroidota bacterium]MDW8225055.1 VanZ family protein [Bacteroidota bacterium]